jgi:hypothetical protein
MWPKFQIRPKCSYYEQMFQNWNYTIWIFEKMRPKCSYYEQMFQNWNYTIWIFEKIRPKLDIERSKKNQPFNRKASPHTQPKRVHNTCMCLDNKIWIMNPTRILSHCVVMSKVPLLCMHNVCMQVVRKIVAQQLKSLKY